MIDWTQTPKTITIYIPTPYKINLKNLDYLITENYIKLNILDLKQVKLVDLFSEIDIETSEIIVENSKIIFNLNKLKEDLWLNLEFKGTKNEIQERRLLSLNKYNKFVEDKEKLAKDTKKDYEKFALDKSIKVDEERRKELKDKKLLERTQAESSIYDFVEKMDIQENNNKDKDKERQLDLITKSSNLDKINNLNFEDKDQFKNKESFTKINNNNNNNKIFNEQDLKANIRQSSNITVKLTEKLIPHFAARESMSKEPPHPKSKKYNIEKNLVKIFLLKKLLERT